MEATSITISVAWSVEQVQTAPNLRVVYRYLRPDRLWGPPNLLYNGYRELFPGGKAAGA
jgi:hypothetical protein